MKNDDYILFEHGLSVKDLKSPAKSVLYSFISLCFCSFFLFLKVDFLSKTPFLIQNLYFLSIALGIFFIVSCMLLKIGTLAKIILTEDKIVYKPPVSKRVYEMEYSCVKSLCYEKSTLFVEGKNQQQLAVCLDIETANKIIDIINEKILETEK